MIRKTLPISFYYSGTAELVLHHNRSVRHQSAPTRSFSATYPLREKDRDRVLPDTGRRQEAGSRPGRARPPQRVLRRARADDGSARPLFREGGQELVSIDSADILRSSFPLSKAARSRAAALRAGREPADLRRRDGAGGALLPPRAPLDGRALRRSAPARRVAAYFDVWILRLSGLFPNPAECAGCGGRSIAGRALFDEARPGFVRPRCRRGEALRLSSAARETLSAILAAPLDPAARPPRLPEIAEVARRARRHFLGHELKSQRVLEDVRGEKPLR